MTPPDIVEFVTDPQLLGLAVSPAQRTLLKSIYGLALDGDEFELWRQCTGRATYPGRAFGETTAIAGARAGKDSRIAVPVACYEAFFGGHERHLGKGERAVIPLVAQDLRGTRVANGYTRDYLTRSPLLRGEAADIQASEITLTNGVTIMTFPCTLHSLRGFSIPAGVMDELGFFRLEGQADADVEIQQSIRRGMLGFPSPRLVKISTPYMRSGVLYEDFARAWAQDDPDLLVWKAPTALMNPTITATRLERERRLDPLRFSREYEAEFSEDVAAFLPGAWVDEAAEPRRHEVPPRADVAYLAAVDPFGGGRDRFTCAVVHVEGARDTGVVVQDVMRGWGSRGTDSVDLDGIVAEICGLLKAYRVRRVVGDRYSAGWVRQSFRKRGVLYDEAPDKSTAYLETEPLFAQGRIHVLDHPQLLRELKLLERRPRPGGRTVVDHPRGGSDDFANALCLAAARAASRRPLLEGYPPPTPVVRPRLTAWQLMQAGEVMGADIVGVDWGSQW